MTNGNQNLELEPANKLRGSIIIAVILLLTAFIFGIGDEVLAKQKKYKRYYRKPVKRRIFYRYRHRPLKLYQELFLTPKIRRMDIPLIESELKEKGVNSVRVDPAHNSVVVQYSSKILSAVDIMQILRDIGYTVSSID